MFGDNVDTDQISPGKVLTLPLEEQMKCVFEALRPEFREEVKPGDVIVAGLNFGCGSSREHSPEVLKALAISAILAESFGRIFFRNAVAIGLPVLIAPGIRSFISEGEQVEVDVFRGTVKNLATGAEFKTRPLHPSLLAIIKAGGIIAQLREELSQ